MKKLHLGAISLFLFACLALAQNTGRISGSVTDGSGAAVPGATINLFIPGGASPVLSTTSSDDGNYYFAGVQPVTYDMAVEANGFRKEMIRGIKVNTGVELSMRPTKLEVATQNEVVEVKAELTTVQTSNSEVASTITNEQVRRLPLIDRSPLGLIMTQAGVSSNARSSTTINGLRPSYTNITIDGINIQDNFIRTNALDFLPNLLLLDQVAEFTVATSNTNAADGSGAAQVKFVTPSGTNDYHGAVYWYNRNNVAAANTWFNNKNNVKKPFLNQNQLGGVFSGKIIKDKLFFYSNYEALRLRQQSPATRTILTPDARNGIMTYKAAAGAIQKVNILQASGIPMDPKTKAIIDQIPDGSKINNNDVGDGLNTAGYAFNVQNNRTRDNVTGKLDYVLSPKNVFSASVLWNRDIVDRPDQANDYSAAPKVTNNNTTKLISGTWRWSPVSTITNELRGGFNLAPGIFATTENFGSFIVGLPLVSNPLNTFRGQGRNTNTYNLSDNANWFKGKHSLSFGMSYQNVHADPYNDAGITPTYNLGMSSKNPNSLTAALLPGISGVDLITANSLLALTGGFANDANQTFNVNSRTSGFVNGATNLRHLRQQNFSFYASDTWRLTRRLTLTLGTRWEYYTPVDEKDALYLLPVVTNNNLVSTMLSNSTLDFAGNAVGRPYYNKDLNNFSPNIGLAWQPFQDNGKTVLRAGYSINYPNDEFMASIRNSIGTNGGLSSGPTLSGLVSTVSGGLPVINTPVYKVPRTFADEYALNTQAAFAMPDPNLRTPYVQQWSFGIQREISKGVLEVRYIGNHATKQFRGFDYNQVMINDDQVPGYLSAFKQAKINGDLARNATGAFNPTYNSNIAGSQPIPFFNQLAGGGLLTNGTIRNLIDTNAAGELASTYQINQLNGSVNFFRNPLALGTNVMTNYSNATYNAAQFDYRRSMSHGVQFQTNYTFSKSLSDSSGDSQTRFEPFLDNNNAKIERARTSFDQTHIFKINGVWDLPFGKGRQFDGKNAIVNQIIGNWAVSSFLNWTSGTPFSVLSARGTLNRAGRSASNTAVSLVDANALDNALALRMTGNGPYFVAASAIGADGRGVAADGRAPFDGQLFYQPVAGAIGTLQRRMFDSPGYFNIDFSVLKVFQLGEKQRLEFRMESSNFTNHPSFNFGDQTITSSTFGRITGLQSARRVIQFGLYYKF